jgi:short-subunit dehydrogenase
LVLPFEATDYERIPDLVERAWDWRGRVHGLINNAGVTQRSLAIETTFAVYQRLIAVDLLAPIALTQALLPRMVRAGGGRIVAISSVAGTVGVPLRSGYCAAKHGLIGYHDAIRAETEHLGIQVHVVAPGSIRTNVARNALLGDGSRRGVSDSVIDGAISPAESATTILAAIESGTRELILATGWERDAVMLRRRDPDALFDRTSALMREGYAERLAADSGLDP